MISRKRLMNNWLFCENYKKGMEIDKDVSLFKTISLPHNPVDLPLSYFDETVYQKKFCYRKFLPEKTVKAGEIFFLRFEAVMATAQVWLDGVYIGEHKGGYTPFEFDITGKLESTADRMLTVVVDASEDSNVPPFGGQIDYLTYAGIYAEVFLDTYASIFVRNARLWSKNPLDKNPSLETELYIGNTLEKDVPAQVSICVLDFENICIVEKKFYITVPAKGGIKQVSIPNLAGIQLWSIENPYLYTIQISISKQNDDTTKDSFTTMFGFRTAEFRQNGFFLNGKKLKIRGLNRHQSWPYVGYAMPARAQKKDVDILKDELCVNLVRTAHYPQSPHFLNRCDERGLLVFEEIPGWQHIGNEEWKQIALKNVEQMITRDWNHPSIVLWGVRINESSDDDDFYKKTNAIARKLDPSRQTGGVRCIEKSSFLEDVYTMNDFIHSGGKEILRNPRTVTGLDYDVPYLVTEYNGHMYPTKKTDSEERQNEHVCRHIRVQNASYTNENICGAIGWCAFDYNTHNDFGSGDRICHHGVMDIFRLPKFAAWVYGSQVDPKIKPVLKPVSYWARGERSVGGVFPFIILTNCDTLSVQFGNFEPIIIKEKANEFSGLPYPPFILDSKLINIETFGAWGTKWEDITIKGYLQDKEVAQCKMPKNPLINNLSVQVDNKKLCAGEKDVTRITISVLDQYGNQLPYTDLVAHMRITGPARIQGPCNISLRGGSKAFWIESTGEKGIVEISVFSEGFDAIVNRIEVI